MASIAKESTSLLYQDRHHDDDNSTANNHLYCLNGGEDGDNVTPRRSRNIVTRVVVSDDDSNGVACGGVDDDENYVSFSAGSTTSRTSSSTSNWTTLKRKGPLSKVILFVALVLLLVFAKRNMFFSSLGTQTSTSLISASITTFEHDNKGGETTTALKEPMMIPGHPGWSHTAFRVKDPEVSLRFYVDVLGFTVMDTFDFPALGLQLIELQVLTAEEESALPPIGTVASHKVFCGKEDTSIELMHAYGTEKDPKFAWHTASNESDGFRNLAIAVDDLPAVTGKLVSAGYSLKSDDSDGAVTAYDPDGYTIEIFQQEPPERIDIMHTTAFAETVLRIKDPAQSLEYYKRLGMQVVLEQTNEAKTETVYSLVSSVQDKATSLKLLHVHGTEKIKDFKYHTGNELGRQGYGHVGFAVDDVVAASDALVSLGYSLNKGPNVPPLEGIAFAYDPDGYLVELLPRQSMLFGDVLKTY